MVSALVTWGIILDRSLDEIAAASADPATSDGWLVNQLADVWDNNAAPFFGAALARTKRRREHLARAGLIWMADFGPERRTWALTHTTDLGYPLNLPDPAPARPDNTGRGYPLHLPDPAPARPHATDRGHPPNLADLGPTHSHATDCGHPPNLAEQASARPHTTDCGHPPNLAEQASARPRTTEPPETGSIHGVARVAVRLLHWAMIQARVVGFLAMEGKADKAETPLHALALALAGTGAGVVAGGTSRFNRDAAFLNLITTWLHSSPEAREWFLHQLHEIATFPHEDPAVQTTAADILRSTADN